MARLWDLVNSCDSLRSTLRSVILYTPEDVTKYT
jgi:hypothetical protein